MINRSLRVVAICAVPLGFPAQQRAQCWKRADEYLVDVHVRATVLKEEHESHYIGQERPLPCPTAETRSRTEIGEVERVGKHKDLGATIVQDRALHCRVNEPVGRDRDIRLLLEPEKDRSSARVGRANIEASLLIHRPVREEVALGGGSIFEAAPLNGVQRHLDWEWGLLHQVARCTGAVCRCALHSLKLRMPTCSRPRY
eukprot:scaffold98034_cov63-Phaeocystis_antarctica.AAC.9